MSDINSNVFRADQKVRQMRRAVRLAGELEGQAKVSFNHAVDVIFDTVFGGGDALLMYPDKFLRLLPDVLQLAADVAKRAFRHRSEAFGVRDSGQSAYKKLVVQSLLSIVGMQSQRATVTHLANAILGSLCKFDDDGVMTKWLIFNDYVSCTRRLLNPKAPKCTSYAGQPGRNMIA